MFFADTSKTTLIPPLNTNITVSDIKKGILKSKSGCVGLFPTDLSSELKSRLKKSTHASVSNLKKSATTVDNTNDPTENFEKKDEEGQNLSQDSSAIRLHSESSSESDDEIEPGKNLAKILRSVSKASTSLSTTDNTDENTKELLKSLVNVGKSAQHARAHHDDNDGPLCGKELLSAVKNSTEARRKKINER